LQRVVADFWVEQFGCGQVAVDHQAQGVAVGGFGHQVGGDVAAGANLVFDDHWLAQQLRQGLGQGARCQVG